MIPAGRRLHRKRLHRRRLHGRRLAAPFTLFTQTWSITDGH
jgi:hypothetical protein